MWTGNFEIRSWTWALELNRMIYWFLAVSAKIEKQVKRSSIRNGINAETAIVLVRSKKPQRDSIRVCEVVRSWSWVDVINKYGNT